MNVALTVYVVLYVGLLPDRLGLLLHMFFLSCATDSNIAGNLVVYKHYEAIRVHF